MEFSAKDLEDIQRVAGLLNLTVDELIQQRRRASNLSDQSNTARQIPTEQAASSRDFSTLPPSHGLSELGSSLAWQSAQGSHYHHDESMDVDSFEFEEYIGQPSAASATTDEAQDEDTEIILLNPQSTWYDCDAALWTYNESTGEHLPLDEASIPDGDGDESYVPVTPMQLDTNPESYSTTQDETQDRDLDGAGTEWAMVSSSPGSVSSFRTPVSPTTGSVDKRYHPIAPKTGKSASRSASQSSLNKARKKRSPYQGAKKKDTHLTRQVHACVRCRMQRNRCIPDPINPRGPCLTCQQKTVRMSRLPCLRYMVTDSTLFRTSLDYMPFYKSHPMIGPHHGDFHIDRQWTGSATKFLCLGQLQVPMNFQVELREFIPPANNTEVDLKGRPMYAVPWAVADPDAVVIAMNEYIDRGITQYLYEYLDDTNHLVWDIFQQAYRASIFPTPNRMLQKTLKLWTACRFIESKWRCWADNGWEDCEIRNANPKDPFYDWDSLPPYLDYQIASIIIHRVLSPLRKEVLRELQGTFNTHNPKDWYVTFLTSFILLQNYEMQMNFQRQFAKRRQATVQYLDMPLVRATNSGAKTILAHFHYCYKGQQLFSKGFDWKSPRVWRLARLDPEQTSFMSQCRDLVVERAPSFKSINHGNKYHEAYWYTSQLFDSDWTPRDTLEHAPPVETPSPQMARPGLPTRSAVTFGMAAS